jgi:hypothetical protein
VVSISAEDELEEAEDLVSILVWPNTPVVAKTLRPPLCSKWKPLVESEGLGGTDSIRDCCVVFCIWRITQH